MKVVESTVRVLAFLGCLVVWSFLVWAMTYLPYQTLGPETFWQRIFAMAVMIPWSVVWVALASTITLCISEEVQNSIGKMFNGDWQ